MDKRTRILEAAEKSFSMFGFKATTMDQVAKLADVGKGTIYTFFKNKDELFNEIIEDLVNEMIKKAEAAINPKESFFINLHRALYEVLEFRKEHQLTHKLAQEVEDIGTGNAGAALNKFEKAILIFLERRLSNALDNGKIAPCDPAKTAFVLYKLYIALVFDWEEQGESLSKEEIAQLFDRYIVLGLEPREAAE